MRNPSKKYEEILLCRCRPRAEATSRHVEICVVSMSPSLGGHRCSHQMFPQSPKRVEETCIALGPEARRSKIGRCYLRHRDVGVLLGIRSLHSSHSSLTDSESQGWLPPDFFEILEASWAEEARKQRESRGVATEVETDRRTFGYGATETKKF